MPLGFAVTACSRLRGVHHLGALLVLLARSEVAKERKQRRAWQAAIADAVAAKPELKATCASALERWRAWPLSYAFDSWRAGAQERRRVLEATASAVFAYAGSLLRKAFITWRDAATTQRVWRTKVSAVVVRMGGFKLQRSFFFWRALAPYLRHMRGAMQAIQARRGLRTKRQVWVAWRYRVEFGRVARKVRCFAFQPGERQTTNESLLCSGAQAAACLQCDGSLVVAVLVRRRWRVSCSRRSSR